MHGRCVRLFSSAQSAMVFLTTDPTKLVGVGWPRVDTHAIGEIASGPLDAQNPSGILRLRVAKDNVNIFLFLLF